MRQRRVLILRHGYYPRDPRVRREAAALVAAGHAVEIVCLRDREEVGEEVVAGVRVTRLPVRHLRAGIGRYVWEYAAFFVGAAGVASWRHWRRRYDVVQVNTLPDALVFAACVPKLLGARVVLDLHEVMPELAVSKFGLDAGHPLIRLVGWTEQAAIRFADACLAVSQPCLDRYVQRGADPRKFTVVMNSPDPGLFGEGGARSSGLRDARGAPDARGPRLVSHGTLVARYGYDLIVRALARLPGVALEILGDGEARPMLEGLARELGVEGRVTFAGAVPLEAIPLRLAGAAVGVVANRRDAFTDLVVPTKLMEYMALGIPAAVARTPAVEAHFGAGEVAFFDSGDAEDLARVVGELLADPARREAMAERAAAALSARYGWPAMAVRYLGVMEAGGGSWT